MPAPAAQSDEDLMLAYAAGDAVAFDTLYARHKGGVFRYLLRQCRQSSVADELFQDVWTNLIRARASYASLSTEAQKNRRGGTLKGIPPRRLTR